MVLSIASLALTCLPVVTPPQDDPKPILSASEVKSLNKKAKKWYDSWFEWDAAESSSKRARANKSKVKAQDDFRKDWDSKSEKKGDLLASVPDMEGIFANIFPYDRVSGLSGVLKQVKVKDGPTYYHVVPRSYKPDNAIRTVLMLPSYDDNKGAWASSSEVFEGRWKDSTLLADSALVFPQIDDGMDLDSAPELDEEGDLLERSRVGAVLAPAGAFQKQFNMDRNAFYLDAGSGSSAFGLRMAINFPNRFAGIILRSPVNDEDLRLGSLTGLPILLVSGADTKEDCDALAKRINDLEGSNCTVIEGEGEFPYLASNAKIAEWLTSTENSTRRDLFRNRVVIQPITDRFKKGYWVAMGTAEPLSSLAPEDRPFIEAIADRKTNRITVTTKALSDFSLMLNDELIDLSKEFTVVINGTAYTEQRDRNFRRMTQMMFDKFDASWLFPVEYSVPVPKSDG
ncbi:MAG: hypothetical protein ACYTG5_18795 [Planctomycetota bacterium]|jgi:hypothetical protein